jgi:hypothetical protein
LEKACRIFCFTLARRTCTSLITPAPGSSADPPTQWWGLVVRAGRRRPHQMCPCCAAGDAAGRPPRRWPAGAVPRRRGLRAAPAAASIESAWAGAPSSRIEAGRPGPTRSLRKQQAAGPAPAAEHAQHHAACSPRGGSSSSRENKRCRLALRLRFTRSVANQILFDSPGPTADFG